MNSTLLRILAICLALGAILTAAIGYRLSTRPVPAVVAPPPPTYPHVVAARDIPAGVVLTAQDVRLESLPQRDASGYDTVGKVVGKLTQEPIPGGTPVLSRHFPRLGKVAQALKPGERGVAIKVTEVIGVGGFVTPGDHVDVLLYVRGNKETADTSSAQVVLRDVRVLAYGEETGETDEAPGMLQKAAGEDPNAPKGEKAKKENEKGKSSRSAILAVREQDAARLMLADHGGEVRLALRGAEPPDQAAKAEDAQHYVRLAELSAPVATAKPPQAGPVPASSTRTAVRKTGTATKKKAASDGVARVTVHRGDQVEVVTVRN